MSGEKPEATILERIDNTLRYFTGDFRTGMQRAPETLLVALKSVEYLVPELIIRAFGGEAVRVYQSLMTFFLCWNRHTGVAPTLNISLLLKR